MVAIVKVAIRSREQLATLRVRDGVLVMETMLWPDEIRTPDFAFLDDDIAARPQELAMAESLVESMSGDFEPEQYHDDYREALQQVIEAKIEGREVVEPEETAAPAGGDVIDLMAALRQSVAAAKQARGEESAAPAKKAPAKKAAAKKAPARKAAAGEEDEEAAPARKTTAKKAPAKKAPAKKAPAKKAPAKKAATRRSA